MNTDSSLTLLNEQENRAAQSSSGFHRGAPMTAPESDWIGFEIVDIVRHSVWKCARHTARVEHHDF